MRVSDQVEIKKGSHKGSTADVVAICLRTRKVHLSTINVKRPLPSQYRRGNPHKEIIRYRPIDASNLVITKLEMTRSRKLLIERKALARAPRDKVNVNSA